MAAKNNDIIPADPRKAPRKANYTTKDIIEHITTHDITPCTTAWHQKIIHGKSSERPGYSIQIYSTTPDSANTSHLDSVALKIFKKTFDERNDTNALQRHRLDFYGLEFPTGTSEDEKVERCIAHQKLEIAARNATGKLDLFIPGTYDTDYWQRCLYIIIEPEEKWVEGEEAFLMVMYDLVEKEREEDDQVDEVIHVRMGTKMLGECFGDKREMRRWFHEEVVGAWESSMEKK